MKSIHVIIDGQYGSTGKGLLAGVIAKDKNIDTICTAWGPNAGHTFIDKNGNKYVHTMLANGIVGPSVRRVLIGPGSVINPENLEKEINAADSQLDGVNIVIHPHAAIVTDSHREAEDKSMTAIGSTKKGVGEAVIQRIRRDPSNQNTAIKCDHPLIRELVVDVDAYNWFMDRSENVMIEGAQGFSLSMYYGFYPYTTSRDVSTHQVLADCAIPFNAAPISVYGSFRTFPIRVANRYNEKGEMVGTSGPCYSDQREMEWSELGMEPELTTVTKLPRRIFTWSETQYLDAIRMLGVTHPFINFMNYIEKDEIRRDFIERLNRIGPKVKYLGFGPCETDVISINEEWPNGA